MNESIFRYAAPSPSMGKERCNNNEPHCKAAALNAKGFSLIEIIVSLMLVGIMSAAVYSYMGSTLSNSVFPVVWLNDAQTANSVMEQIKADYDEKFETYPASGWLYNFFDNEIKNASFISDVDNYEYESGNFDGSYTWFVDPNGPYLKVTLTKGLQKVIAVFSE